jgi:hypothetical protein
MYSLILVAVLNASTAIATVVDINLSMEECFEQRENLLIDRAAWDGFFDDNTQAICIKVK